MAMANLNTNLLIISGTYIAATTDSVKHNASSFLTVPSSMLRNISTSNIFDDTKNHPGLINNELVKIFFSILYTTVFVLGIFGNVLVCYVVLQNRAMQTVTNLFITNLALSDILLCVLAVPFTPLYTFMGRWAFGRTLCHLVSFAQGCSIYISTLTLTSIAIDRFFVIIYPFHPRMKLSTCIGIILAIWVVSLLSTLPYGLYMKVVMDVDNKTVVNNYSASTNNTKKPLLIGDSSYSTDLFGMQPYTQMMTADITLPLDPPAMQTYCEENWPSEQYRKLFGAITTTLQFVLPFLIITICYVWISIKLNARVRARKNPGSKLSRREEADQDRKKRTNRMLVAMVGVFALSWLPINLVNIYDDFYVKSNEWPYYIILFFVAHSIAMSSTCYNPFLYAWLNENFRKEFKHVLPCFNPSHTNNTNFRGINKADEVTVYAPRLYDGSLCLSKDNDDNIDNSILHNLCSPPENVLSLQCKPAHVNAISNLNTSDVTTEFVHIWKAEQYKEIIKQTTDVVESLNESYDKQTEEMRICETTFVRRDTTLINNIAT